MEVRTLDEHHLPALLKLYTHLHTIDDALPDPAEVEKIWTIILSNEFLVYFGVFLKSELVSSCNLSIIPNLTRGCRPYGIVENVVTHTQHRQQGYGTAVLNAALDHAWQFNCYKVLLTTSRMDEQLFRFYESVGFKRGEKQAFIARPNTHALHQTPAGTHQER